MIDILLLVVIIVLQIKILHNQRKAADPDTRNRSCSGWYR